VFPLPARRCAICRESERRAFGKNRRTSINSAVVALNLLALCNCRPNFYHEFVAGLKGWFRITFSLLHNITVSEENKADKTAKGTLHFADASD
jgi:hypothetical protein